MSALTTLARRTMATLSHAPPITLTAEGAVSVSYRTLTAAPHSLTAAIDRAFGSHPDSLGIIIVRDLPPAYAPARARLLRLAHAFATLDEPTRERFADPASRYSFGWSHGKEIMNGKPDTLKGSYYANPLVDAPPVAPALRAAYPEYYRSNIWPADVPAVAGFEDAFKALGRIVFSVGGTLAAACQPFASPYLADTALPLAALAGSTHTVKARLLHYFPPGPGPSPAATDPTNTEEPVDSWCGFHLDHSLLTGLCSAMYLRPAPNGAAPTEVPPAAPAAGLYIRTRGGALAKVAIPADCLAFQTGEALELATAGALRATPHCVRVGGAAAGAADGVSRETFALFMQPDTEQRLSAEMTFGQFSKRVFDEHYEGGGGM